MVKDEEDEDDIIEETPEYAPKSEFSKPYLVSESVKACTQARGQEMQAGFWNVKLSKTGDAFRTWVKDSRKENHGTVMALYNLLAPEIKRDKEFQEIDNKVKEDKKNLFETYAYEERIKIQEEDADGQTNYKWKLTGRKFIPEINASTVRKIDPRTGVSLAGAWDNEVNLYWDNMVEVDDKLFRGLMILIDKLDYFKAGIRYG